MGKLAVFRRQASPGAMVTLRLSRGEDVTGRVTELDESHVCVDLGHRVVTIFEDILAGWEIHQSASGIPAKTLATKSAAAELSLDQPLSEAQSATPVEALSPVSDPAVLARRSRIDATYAGGIDRARLTAPEPDFSISDAEFPPTAVSDVRREWDRARNQYSYAMKVREESRLINIVGQVLRPLIERYPRSPSLHALTGGLLLKLGRRVEAVEHFRKAAHESRKSDHWYALAYATTAPALECYALRNYLVGTRVEEAREAWLRYLALAVDHSDRSGVVRLLEHCFSQAAGSATWEMAAETLIYLYGKAGEHSVADQATVALVRGQAFPPEGWREVIGRILREPSPELGQEEELDTVRTERPSKLSSVPSGRIVSFGNQRFGFIDAEDGETYFFRLDDVADDGLKQALLDGHWRGRAKVEFTPLPSVGHSYQRAVEILPLQDVSALLNRARQLRQINQHAQAMAFVRRALAAEPDSPDAQMLEADIKEEIRVRGIGLPKDKGPYARAKRAQLVDQDLVSAERLFRLAIQQGDKPESATKDLASLLQQQGRFDDAMALLESKRSLRRDVGPYDNMLATLYQQLGRHQEAVGLLKALERRASPRTRPPILRRIAFSHFKSGSYDEAERTLRALLAEAPGDRTAERWLAGLEEARRSGSYDDAAEIIGGLGALAEEGFELSPLARVAIDGCAFEGVDPSRLQSGSLTDKDVDRLEDLAKKLGTRRPRDRAAYYLSAAAILSRRGFDEDAARIYDYLRRHFASMGDAAWVDKRPADVVRTYYIESLALVSDRQLDEAWRTLVRYLATFSSAGPESSEDLLPRAARRGSRIPTSEYVASLQSVLNSTLSDRLLVMGTAFDEDAIWA